MAVELVEPVKRVEHYLYALCVMDFNNIPIPRSRLEFFAHALITGVLPEFQAETREEVYITAIITGDYANLPLPKSRADQLLYKICLGETEIRDIELETRYEMLLAYIAEHGDMPLETVLVECINALQTIPNTVEVPVKSAILSGNTLVNIITKNSGTISRTSNNSRNNLHIPYHYKLIPNKKYYVTFKVSNITGDTTGVLNVSLSNGQLSNQELEIKDGRFSIITSSRQSEEEYLTGLAIYFVANGTDTSCDISEIMVVEYQDGMENWDIPYFEGMQSVKMPVLSTIGKNLFDINKCISGKSIDDNGELINSLPHHYAIEEFIKIDNTITVSVVSEDGAAPDTTNGTRLRFYDKNKKLISSNWFAGGVQIQNNRKKRTFTVNGAEYLRLNISASGGGADTSYKAMKTIQIENGSSMTSYEPYKSNILTVNEDVELRDIKDAKNFNGSSIGKKFTDVLDCINGELKIQTNKVTMDGNKQPILSISKENVSIFKYKPNDILINSSYDAGNIFICDKLKYVSALWEKDEEGYCYSNNDGIMFSISNNKFTDINEYLSQNPITFIYPLAQESIKTVDLTITDQDGNVKDRLSTFNDATHVSINAVDIIPQVDLEVRVDVNTMANVASQQENVAVAQASLSDAIDAQNDDIEMTKQALDEVKGE